MSGETAILTGGWWVPTRDADPRARALFDRHYSRRRYRDGRRPAKFVGPGEYIALVTAAYDALLVWRRFIDDAQVEYADGKTRGAGVNCAVFRNEGPHLSSMLIREADEIAWAKWPGERLYTYVQASAVRSSNPGYCFLMAGWRRVGLTKGGLVVLEIEGVSNERKFSPKPFRRRLAGAHRATQGHEG